MKVHDPRETNYVDETLCRELPDIAPYNWENLTILASDETEPLPPTADRIVLAHDFCHNGLKALWSRFVGIAIRNGIATATELPAAAAWLAFTMLPYKRMTEAAAFHAYDIESLAMAGLLEYWESEAV